MPQNFTVVDFPARILIGKSAEFYGAMSPKFNGQEKLGPVWGLMQAKRIELGLPEGSMMIGATQPADSQEAANGLLKQFVGCVVDEIPADLLGLDVFEISSGSYATCEHVGGMESLSDSIQEFYSQMIPAAGCTQRSGLHLEIYDERFDLTKPDSVMVIAAPIQ
ncbi:MAG: Integron-associated effector binding protein [Actinomycetota bacterium]|jgi:predicted transcriptional regulator YdeE